MSSLAWYQLFFKFRSDWSFVSRFGSKTVESKEQRKCGTKSFGVLKMNFNVSEKEFLTKDLLGLCKKSYIGHKKGHLVLSLYYV